MYELLLSAAILLSLFSAIFSILTFYSGGQKPNPVPNKIHGVSIIIPAHNEAHCIAETIENAKKIDWPKLEVLVVENGGSTDGTYEIAKRYASKQVRVFSIAEGGKGRALNYGIRQASGEIIVVMDADTIARPDILWKMMGYFNDSEVMSVTASVKPKRFKSICERLQAVEYIYATFARRVFSVLNAIFVVFGAFTAYRKKFFEKAGGFDTNNLVEDFEMTLRTYEYGYKVKAVIDAIAYTNVPNKFSELTKQRVRWNLGTLDNLWSHRHMFNKKYKYFGLLVLPITVTSLVLMIAIFGFVIALFIRRLLLWLPILKDVIYSFLLAPGGISRLVRASKVVLDPFYMYITPLGVITIMTIILVYAILLITKKHSPDPRRFGLSFAGYVLIYSFIFAYWWFLSLGYKIFGREIRFGCVRWRNSLINKVINS